MDKKNMQKNGYTLIEILIVLGFTVFLFSAAIQSFISTSTQFAFNNAAEKVLDMVRFARSLAISGKAFQDYTDFNKNSSTADFVTPANYGIYFEHNDDRALKDSVILFADNHQILPTATCLEKKYDAKGEPKDGCDILIEKFELPAGIKLSLPADKNLSIFYSPIFADITFDPPPVSSSLIIGIEQSTPLINRKRCFSIHVLSGNPEPIDCHK